ncbi:MAG TPA: Uma2 family endonuclease [Tepidisphaeraceae bacterium]|nr:Uma2 family endonuclease [Tepidisphaeraceae bacterium]
MSRAITSPKVRFTVREYLRMAEGGVLKPRGTELIEGRIVKMAPQRDPHMFAVMKTTRALLKALPEGDFLAIQGTLRLGDRTMVDPDFFWCATPWNTPEAKRPTPSLVIEISHSSYRRDAGIKLRKYAQHGIADYWIVHLEQNRVEVYRDPQNPTGKSRDCRYASVTHHARGERMALLARPEVTLQVSDLLP